MTQTDPLSTTGHPWWRCPNTPPCPHGAILHDVEEYSGDGTDTCCADGCQCRGPAARPVTC